MKWDNDTDVGEKTKQFFIGKKPVILARSSSMYTWYLGDGNYSCKPSPFQKKLLEDLDRGDPARRLAGSCSMNPSGKFTVLEKGKPQTVQLRKSVP